MRNEGIARRIWILLAKEGGRWSPKEVSEELGIPFPAVNRALYGMANDYGSLSRVKVGKGSRFGVTGKCVLPVGVTVGDLVEVGVVKTESE